MDTFSLRKKLTLPSLIYLGLLSLLASSIDLSGRLLGSDEDVWIFYWNDWWLREAFANGHSPFFTDLMFAPNGTSLLAHSNSFLNSFLALLIEPLLGSVAAYNLVIFFGFWVGALGMFVLVHEQTDSFTGALFAGFVFMAMPYHVTQALAHGHLGSIHWWPWFMWALWQTVQQKSLKFPVLAGVFAAFTFWSGLQIALLLAIWAGLFLLWF